MGKKGPVRSGKGRATRKFGEKEAKPLVVFAVEGETERAYLKALRTNRYDDRIAFTFASTGTDTSLTTLVSAIQRKITMDGAQAKGAWIVCDTDQNACHRKRLNAWIAKSKQHHAVISHPCIEYWLVLHVRSTSSSRDAQHAVKELDKAWPGGNSYRKGAPIPARLIDDTDLASRRVHERRRGLDIGSDAWNSPQWTDMPELIAWLDDLDPRNSIRASPPKTS